MDTFARTLKLLTAVIAFAAGTLTASASDTFIPLPLNDAWNALVHWETQANSAGTRPSTGFPLEHVEIPLEMLIKSEAMDLDPALKNAMIVDRDGKKYVRWIIHPEDTHYVVRLENWLKKNNLSDQRYKHFTGYWTASRSLIVVDPLSQKVFSLKGSTNRTVGRWTEKHESIRDAFAGRYVSDYIHDVSKIDPPEHFEYVHEPLMFGIKDLDQGMILRDYDKLNSSSEKRYISAFAALNDEEGRTIARLNGSTDPAAYWEEHLLKPWAKATAELFAKFGITLNSPHSQNFLLELDKNKKPTGKIIFRDLSDCYLLGDVVRANGGDRLIEHYLSLEKIDPDNAVFKATRNGGGPTSIEIFYSLFHGGPPPKWLHALVHDEKYKMFASDREEAWAKTFFNIIENYLIQHFGYISLRSESLDLDGRNYHASGYIGLTNEFKSYLEQRKTLFRRPFPTPLIERATVPTQSAVTPNTPPECRKGVIQYIRKLLSNSNVSQD